ncbi:MAG TPA: PEP/pyruvate-binding domain-containing protein, partial [Bacteroidota bacterium]|nr:PEP/pyruvate-binding domain-containing protein [Bacteroidota bacterium]
MKRKYTYSFGGGKADGRADMKALLGGKGANLAEMTNIGLLVPPGFTISTEISNYFFKHDGRYPKNFRNDVLSALRRVEKLTKKKFGDPVNPLLVSVRSGARASMPGMMDTILNLGLNDITIKGLIAATENKRFAYDSYRRLVQMYGDVVLGLKPEGDTGRDPFEIIIENTKGRRGVEYDTDLTSEDLRDLVKLFRDEIQSKLGVEFPQDPLEQLWGAIDAVCRSWMNERAIAYRKLNNIPEHWGTAVNIQAMVFGNMGESSGTGVAFTRDPATGENEFYGEFLMNAQGEDVVSGVRTPLPINVLAERYPKIHKQLLAVRKNLEKHYRDMQDIEFTIEQGKLYMLQTRNGKRTGFSALRIAVDMVTEGLIKPEEAVMRVEPDQL